MSWNYDNVHHLMYAQGKDPNKIFGYGKSNEVQKDPDPNCPICKGSGRYFNSSAAETVGINDGYVNCPCLLRVEKEKEKEIHKSKKYFCENKKPMDQDLKHILIGFGILFGGVITFFVWLFILRFLFS